MLISKSFDSGSIKVIDASECAFPDGWKHYNVCASYDRDTWFRVPSANDGESLSWTITPEQDSLYFAYYVP